MQGPEQGLEIPPPPSAGLPQAVHGLHTRVPPPSTQDLGA